MFLLDARPRTWWPSALALALALAACGSPSNEAPRACSDLELAVAASDYSSSAVGGAPRTGNATLASGLDLGKDPQLASSGGRLFYIARDTDLLFELDAACATPRSRFSVHDLAPRDAHTGLATSANPHDAAVAPDGNVWIPLYNTGKLAFIKDGRLDGSLDLSSYDPDGNPQAEAIRIVNVGGAAKAFVALERLDDADMYRSTRSSLMLRVDVATRTVETSIELAGRNPFNVMAELAGALFLAEPGNVDADREALAGIERFDAQTSTTRLLVPEADFGASVMEVAVTDGCGAAIVAGPQKDVNPTALVTFDPATGRVLTTYATAVLGPTPGYDLQALAWKGASLYVGDRRPVAGGYAIHVFDRSPNGCTLQSSTRTILVPQRPVAMRPTLG